MNTAEAVEAIKNVHFPRKLQGETSQSFVERRQAYNKKVADIRNEWANWLWEEYGYDIPDRLQETIFSRAWEDGHASGLHEVEMHFEELCRFTREVRES